VAGNNGHPTDPAELPAHITADHAGGKVMSILKILGQPGPHGYRRIDVSAHTVVQTVKEYKSRGYSIAEKRFDGAVLTRGGDIVEIVFARSYMDDLGEFDKL
jgi:hypothetical protein